MRPPGAAIGYSTCRRAPTGRPRSEACRGSYGFERFCLAKSRLDHGNGQMMMCCAAAPGPVGRAPATKPNEHANEAGRGKQGQAAGVESETAGNLATR
jgi:hypothetical protein